MGRPSRNCIISFDGFNPRNAVTHILYECPPYPAWLYVGRRHDLGKVYASRLVPLAPIASARPNPEKLGKTG